MAVNALKFLAILFTALALVPSGAHLMELANKIDLPAEEYLVVQSIYRGWALSGGVFVVGALLATLTLAFVLHGRPGFTPAAIAVLCIFGTQILFWSFTYSANVATQNWTVLPQNWQVLRTQWEYSHAAGALLNLGAFVAATMAVLRASDASLPSRAVSA